MIEIIELPAGERLPALTDDEPWLTVEASDDGRFFGTGFAYKSTGEGVFYASLPESDVSLDAALTAASDWAAKYDVRRLWVQSTPANGSADR